MADLIDVGSIINDEGQLCAGPFLEAFNQINAFCETIETFMSQNAPEGALLANGSVEAQACLSYASDAQTCAEPGSIPSWSQVLNLFNCGKETVTTSSDGRVTIPGVGTGKVFYQLASPRPTGVVSLELEPLSNDLIAVGPTGSPAPGEEICVQYLEYLG